MKRYQIFLALVLATVGFLPLAQSNDDWRLPALWDWATNVAYPLLEDHSERLIALETEVAMLQSQLPGGSPVNPAFLRPLIVGDSWSNDGGDWPDEVSVTDMSRNESISGERLSWMATKFESYLDAHPDADSLILQGGINDLAAGKPEIDMATAVTTMVALAKARGHIEAIILMGPGPFKGHRSWAVTKQTRLERYLLWMSAFCLEQAIHCFNTYEQVNDESPNQQYIKAGWTADYLHLLSNSVATAHVAQQMDVLIAGIRGD